VQCNAVGGIRGIGRFAERAICFAFRDSLGSKTQRRLEFFVIHDRSFRGSLIEQRHPVCGTPDRTMVSMFFRHRLR